MKAESFINEAEDKDSLKWFDKINTYYKDLLPKRLDDLEITNSEMLTQLQVDVEVRIAVAEELAIAEAEAAALAAEEALAL